MPSKAGRAQLCSAALLAGFFAHIHIANLISLPFLIVYAYWPLRNRGMLAEQKRNILWSLFWGSIGLLLLGLSHWWRFGDPFETGRYGYYSHWVLPFEGLAAQVFAPGRSFFLYSPAVFIALFGLKRFHRHQPALFYLTLGICLSRWVFISFRSDWYGGWGLGPRYLLPILPFAILPLAEVFSSFSKSALWKRALILGCLLLSVLLELHLAAHSMFQWMVQLLREYGRAQYMSASHWIGSSSPIYGFWKLERPLRDNLIHHGKLDILADGQFDMLFIGAIRLSKAGHWSLLSAFAVLGLLAAFSAFFLLRFLCCAPPPPKEPSKIDKLRSSSR